MAGMPILTFIMRIVLLFYLFYLFLFYYILSHGRDAYTHIHNEDCDDDFLILTMKVMLPIWTPLEISTGSRIAAIVSLLKRGQFHPWIPEWR